MLTRVRHNYSVGKGFNLTFPPTGSITFPPYGTVLAWGNSPNTLTYSFASHLNTYFQFDWGNHDYSVIADGVGGSFIAEGNVSDTTAYNYVIRDDADYSSDSRIIYKGNGSWSECAKYGIATGTGGTGTAYVYVSEVGYDVVVGGYDWSEIYDGFCSTTYSYSYSYYPYGTWIVGYSGGDAYSDGNGSYYTQSSNPSYGTWLYDDGGSSDLTWYAPDGSSGNYTYSTWGCSYYADGNGGSYSSCGGWTATYATVITSGYYYYNTGNTDENGNSIYEYRYYEVMFDGYTGYYTYEYTVA